MLYYSFKKQNTVNRKRCMQKAISLILCIVSFYMPMIYTMDKTKSNQKLRNEDLFRTTKSKNGWIIRQRKEEKKQQDLVRIQARKNKHINYDN